LIKKAENLQEVQDAEAMGAWEHKLSSWHDNLAPVFNLLRTVTVPDFLHSSRNRTLHRMVLGLQASIGRSEMHMITVSHAPSLALQAVAAIVNDCKLIQWYLEEAKKLGVKDIDEWTAY
jgi:hypothetical protein